jgi:hypothetical protein
MIFPITAVRCWVVRDHECDIDCFVSVDILSGTRLLCSEPHVIRYSGGRAAGDGATYRPGRQAEHRKIRMGLPPANYRERRVRDAGTPPALLFWR